MRVLVVGGGGREHALAWTLAKSAQVDEVLIAPGNGGTAELGRNVAVAADDVDGLVALARDEKVGLVVVGPEDPLVDGLVDRCREAGLAAFGPSAAAAQLEGSKAFAKAFMERHQIPTGRAASFTDVDQALAYLGDITGPVPVIKADGLAAGKGVLMPDTMAEAADAVRTVLVDRRFGDACDRVLIEERLEGIEASVLAFCDGTSLAIMPIAQDHKRLGDGDAGPNTGGMGAFVPSPVIDQAMLADIEARVLRPVLLGMAAEGSPYTGVLYAGIMVTADGIRVLEYNCRFGDPETQVVLPLLRTDLVDIALACGQGTLADVAIQWSTDAAATVVLASGGYPEVYPKGLEITGVDDAGEAGAVVFHAGTARAEAAPISTDADADTGESLVTNGGRVLAVTATATDLDTAVATAYRAADHIHFDGAVRRNDIGRMAPAAAPGSVSGAGPTPVNRSSGGVNADAGG